MLQGTKHLCWDGSPLWHKSLTLIPSYLFDLFATILVLHLFFLSSFLYLARSLDFSTMHFQFLQYDYRHFKLQTFLHFLTTFNPLSLFFNLFSVNKKQIHPIHKFCNCLKTKVRFVQAGWYSQKSLHHLKKYYFPFFDSVPTLKLAIRVTSNKNSIDIKLIKKPQSRFSIEIGY